MRSIHRSEVPEYLQKSGFFAGLDPDDEEPFEVPSDCFKPDTSLESQEDLERLLRTLQFWSVKILPHNVLKFVLTKHQDCKWVLFLLEHREWRSTLSSYLLLAHLPKEHRICQAINLRLGVSIVQWLHENGCDLHNCDCNAAARVNDLPSFKYLRENGCSWDHSTLDAAIRYESIDCFTYAMENHCAGYDKCNVNLQTAIETGSTAIIRHMHTLGYELNLNHLNHAICHNQVGSLRALHELGVLWDDYSIIFTLDPDAVECLQYLIEQGCPWGVHREYCTHAMVCAKGPSLRCLRYAYTHGCTLTTFDLEFAAEQGNVECLQYAHEHGVEWDAHVYNSAVCSWACLWYVWSRGCPSRSTGGVLFSIALVWWFPPFIDVFTISWIVVAFVSAHVGRETVYQPHVLQDVISIPVRDALRVVFGWANSVITVYLLWRMVACLYSDRYD